MFRSKLLIILILITGILISHASLTQNNRNNLESRQKKLNEQISYNKKLLREARRNKQSSISELNILNSQIRMRTELINTINSEIDFYTRRIEENEQLITSLEIETKEMQDEYADLIFISYRNRNTNNKLMYILASENIKQAWLRVKYFKQMSKYRKKKFDDLNEAKERIITTNQEIRGQISGKALLKENKIGEARNLNAEKSQKNRALRSLKSKEKEILAKLRKQEAESAELSRKIQAIIEAEIKKSTKNSKATTEKAKELNSKEIKLSNSFAANKGKLPWPTDKGTISSTFGKHKHPDFNVYTQNNGIDIITTAGQPAKAVFAGTVSEVIKLPSFYAVLVKHGEYFTLYSKLSVVSVKKGDSIKTGQSIGSIYTSEGKTELHFELWKGREKQNPTIWLRKA